MNKKKLKTQITTLLKTMSYEDIKAYLDNLETITKDDLQLLIDIGKTETVLKYLTGYDINFRLDFKTWFVPTEEEFRKEHEEHRLLCFNCFIDYLKGNNPNSKFKEYEEVNQRTEQLIKNIIKGEYDIILNLNCNWEAMVRDDYWRLKK